MHSKALTYLVRRLQRAPLRIGIVEVETGEVLFSIGKEVARQFKLNADQDEPVEACFDADQLTALEEAEKKSLEFKLLTYLSQAERSYRQVGEWFGKRKVSPKWSEPMIAQAEASNYLSHQRYFEGFLKESVYRGRPKWILKKELDYRGVKYNPNDLDDYDEEGAVRHLVERKRIRSGKDFLATKKYLLRKGHKMDLVEKVLKEHHEALSDSEEDQSKPWDL